MPFSQEQLDRVAIRACDLLVRGLDESRLIEGMLEAYREACSGPLARSGVVPRRHDIEDIKRLTFEVLSFAATIAMYAEAPKHIRRRRLLVRNEPDAERVRYFNGKFLDRSLWHFDSQEFSAVREIVITQITPDIEHALGEPLNAVARIADYSQREGADFPKTFGRHVGYALDVERYPFLAIVAAAFIEPVGDLVRLVLKQAFGSRS